MSKHICCCILCTAEGCNNQAKKWRFQIFDKQLWAQTHLNQYKEHVSFLGYEIILKESKKYKQRREIWITFFSYVIETMMAGSPVSFNILKGKHAVFIQHTTCQNVNYNNSCQCQWLQSIVTFFSFLQNDYDQVQEEAKEG